MVTGGGSGLGLAIAKALVCNGAKVVIAGRDEIKLKNACAEIGASVHILLQIFHSLQNIPAFVEQLYQQVKSVDILVNNAGINLKKDALEVTDEEFKNISITNQQAVFALPEKLENGCCKYIKVVL